MKMKCFVDLKKGDYILFIPDPNATMAVDNVKVYKVGTPLITNNTFSVDMTFKAIEVGIGNDDIDVDNIKTISFSHVKDTDYKISVYDGTYCLFNETDDKNVIVANAHKEMVENAIKMYEDKIRFYKQEIVVFESKIRLLNNLKVPNYNL